MIYDLGKKFPRRFTVSVALVLSLLAYSVILLNISHDEKRNPSTVPVEDTGVNALQSIRVDMIKALMAVFLKVRY